MQPSSAGGSTIAIDQKVCQTCLGRRENRSGEWLRNPASTIWLDEISDINGRIALIAGNFDLSPWLQPESYIVSSLPLGQQKGKLLLKNVSFARVSGITDTTERFWQECDPKLNGWLTSGGPRLEIRGSFRSTAKLHQTVAYELNLGSFRLPVVCSEQNVSLRSIENLQRAVKVIDPSSTLSCTEAAAWLRGRLLTAGTAKIDEPTGYGSPNRNLGEFQISAVSVRSDAYTPAIAILTEPRTFLCLVPASEALDIVKNLRVPSSSVG